MKTLFALVLGCLTLAFSQISFAGCAPIGPACVEASANGSGISILIQAIQPGEMRNLVLSELNVHATFNGQDLGSQPVSIARGGHLFAYFFANSPRGRLVFYFHDLHGNYFSNYGQNFQIDL